MVTESASLAGLEERLAAIDWSAAGASLRGRVHALRAAAAPKPVCIGVGDASLLAVLPAVLAHFDPAHDLQRILENLGRESDARYAEWAHSTLKTLAGKSPLMMAVTRELLLRGRRMDLADCFHMEFAVVQHSFAHGDFLEGVRALLEDKDHAPAWRAQSAAQVQAAQVEAFFTSTAAAWPIQDPPA